MRRPSNVEMRLRQRRLPERDRRRGAPEPRAWREPFDGNAPADAALKMPTRPGIRQNSGGEDNAPSKWRASSTGG